MANKIRILEKDGTLPARPASVPAMAMQTVLANPTEQQKYYRQFVATWFLAYERLSVPTVNRFEMTEEVCEKELIPAANRLVEKFPGIGRDVIWKAWQMGVDNYFVDNGKNAFPMFNFGVLILMINTYRHAAMLKLHPEVVSAGELKMPESSNPTMRELLAAIRKMDADQIDLVLELQSKAYQPLFDHLAQKMEAEEPERFIGLKREAKTLWVQIIAEKLGQSPDGLAQLQTAEIAKRVNDRFGKYGAIAIEDTMPNPWSTWRKLLLIDAEVYV